MSLRARLVAALVLVAVVLVASGAAVLGLVRTSLLDEIDRQLATVAPAAASPINEQLAQLGPPPVERRGVGSPFTQLYIAEVSAGGAVDVVLRSDSPQVPSVDGADMLTRAGDPSHPDPFDAQSADGSTHYRAVALSVPTGSVTVLALPTDRVEETYGRVRLGVMAVGGLVVAALALAGWWVERLGIRPIKQVTGAATAIAGGDLERRVETQPRRTEADQLAEAFNVMVDRRQEADARLRQFSADASHELRTPLTTVAGVLELHQSGSLTAGPDLDEALRRASQETARMSGLVEDLLLLSRLDQGRPLERHPVDLTEIVDDAALDASIHQRDRTVTTELADDAFVWGDEPRLRQVVTNLVTNAMAYTPDHGTIALRVSAQGEVCTLEVTDNGPGMAPEVAAHVFDRFFRGDTGRSRKAGGSGLGLSIVASIVEAHRGEVSVATAPDQGTTFLVALPRHRPEPITLG